MNNISGKTKLTGVFGWPAEHSLSPTMQNPAIAKLGLDWVYLALPVPPERLAEAMAGVRAMGFIGVNVTIPHKQAVLALLDEVDPQARAIGAVNTVHFRDGRAIGYNTDASGYTRTIEEESPLRLAGARVLQLGAGGAGRAMAAGAAAAGAAEVILTDLSAERLAGLIGDLAPLYPAVTFTPLPDPAALPAAAARADLIANATPLGMKPGDPLPLPAELIEARHTVFDAVYIAARTPLLAAAEACGARVVPGLGMLARQGSRALEIWSGRRPDEALMIRLLKDALGVA